MAISSAQVTVTSTATLIAQPTTDSNVFVRHHGGDSVFFGGSGVTSSTGILMPTGDVVTIPLNANEALYGVANPTSGTVGVLIATVP